MPRMNVAKTFKGDKYATEKFVDNKIGPLPEGVESVIDSQTNNLNVKLNPIAVASMQNATGSTDFSKLKIIGDCSVNYGVDGTITLRIGPALNCSLFNGTDGISSAVVSYSATGTETATVSSDYSDITNIGSRTIVVKGESDTLKANAGTTQTTESVAGNSVHFEDSENGSFKVYIGTGKGATTETAYTVGPITGNGNYYESGKTSADGSILCSITNFKDEPKLSSGANGKCANVNFTFTPNKLFTETTDFRIIKIEQLEGENVVATWTNSTATVYMFMIETNTPSVPASASYTITKNTKVISGITYLTTSSTVTPSATGLANIGYPGCVSNKLNCSPNGGTWFSSFNETETSRFQTWTDVKDATMNWTGSAKNILVGSYTSPKISVYAINMHGNGQSVVSDSNGAIYVCDTNGYTSNKHGTYADNNRLQSDYSTAFASIDLSSEGNTDLQTFNGYIQYPTEDYSSYNQNEGIAINPNYSSCSGTRYAYLKLLKTGTIMGGTVTIVTESNPQTELTNGSLKIELANSASGTWMDLISEIGTTFSYGTTSVIGFSIPQAANYGSGFLLCRISMTKPSSGTGVRIGNVTIG